MRTASSRLFRGAWDSSRIFFRSSFVSISFRRIAFARSLADADRSDRVIANAWDASFALFDGVPNAAVIKRLSAQVPLQEAGRVSRSELTLSRANRSVRIFDHVRQALAAGRQPDPEVLNETGYLMRTILHMF